MKKYIYSVVSLVLMSVLFIGCLSDNEYYNAWETEEMVSAKDDILTLSEKFQNIQKRGEEVITRSMNIHRSELKLCSYKYVKVIESNDELERIKSQIVSEESVIPYYDLDNKRILLLKWNEFDNQKQYGQIQYSRNSLLDYLDKNLKVGMEQFELTWQCESEIYKTICITSGNAIIYDNIITNTLCISGETHENAEISGNKLLKTRQEQGGGGAYYDDYTLREVVVNETVDWLWGAERGYVIISHSIVVRDGGLDSSGYETEDFMSIGSSGAEAQIISRRYGPGGSSTCNYIYYMVTPTMSATIHGGGGVKYYVTFSGLGSEKHGSGDHVLPML